MTVQALDHIDVRGAAFDDLIRFLGDGLGMNKQPSSGQPRVTGAAWMHDASGHAALHVTDAAIVFPDDAVRPFAPGAESGAIHHVARRCATLPAKTARLNAAGPPYRRSAASCAPFAPLFVVAPGDLLFELNFPDG